MLTTAYMLTEASRLLYEEPTELNKYRTLNDYSAELERMLKNRRIY